jgi:hypothetical protein
MEHRSDQQVGAEEVLVFYAPGLRVFGELEEQRAQRRCAGLGIAVT